ncbi:hypothetical protein A2U01_0050974, partial [Trifolium medium]|nr:hypothetical protein [Trifolium medium]
MEKSAGFEAFTTKSKRLEALGKSLKLKVLNMNSTRFEATVEIGLHRTFYVEIGLQ